MWPKRPGREVRRAGVELVLGAGPESLLMNGSQCCPSPLSGDGRALRVRVESLLWKPPLPTPAGCTADPPKPPSKGERNVINSC